jgi:hypothetical protein
VTGRRRVWLGGFGAASRGWFRPGVGGPTFCRCADRCVSLT